MDISEINTDSTPGNHNGNDENKVLKWVQAVDSHIDENSVEIMKLGMTQSELTQPERENARKPSDLYHALANHYPNLEELLARYVYALEKLGHRKHGFRAVRKLDDFSIQKPNQFNPTGESTEVQDFNFCQCLVDICVHLDISCYSRLNAYACKTFLDGANPKLISSPQELFMRLLQDQVITKEKQKDLVEALHIVGADKCVEYIHCYRHQNGLPEIRDEDYNKATLVSTTSSKTDEGSRSQTLKRGVHMVPGYSCNHQNMQENPNQLENGDDLHQSSGAQETSTRHRKGWKLCFVLIFLVMILILMAAIILLGFTTAALFRKNTNVVLYHDNATVILTQVDHFFTKSLRVTQDTGYPGDSDHEIDLYLLNQECNDLPITEIKYSIYDHSIHALNKSILYLLPNSFITYSVCASTNHTENSDRLELLVLDNLERAQSFDISHSFYAFAYFSIGVDENVRCSDITINIDKPSYYYFIFLPPSHPAQFELNVTYAIRWIDPTQFPEQSNYTLRENQDSHEFFLDSSPQAKKSCLVATISESAFKPYVHIRLQFQRFFESGVEMVIVSAVLVIAILVAMIVLVGCHKNIIISHSQYI